MVVFLYINTDSSTRSFKQPSSHMNSYLLGVVFVLFSTLSLAQGRQSTIDVSELTPEQQSAVQVVANQMAEKKSDAPQILEAIQNIDSSKVSGWAEASTEAGRAVSNFAKEVGVVAQTFLDSSIGKMAFFLVFMNYGGGKLAQFAFDIFAFVGLMPFFCFFMLMIFRRFVLQVVVTSETSYNENPLLRFVGFNKVTKRVEKVTYGEGRGDIPPGWQAFLGWVIIVVSTVLFIKLMWPVWL